MPNPATGVAAPTIWAFYTPQIGYPPIQQTISATDTYPQFAGETAFTNNRGQIVQGYDTTGAQGAGEFIFLLGVAATTVGDLVVYDTSTATSATARWDGTANSGQPLAVAMSANVASQMGWYQIAGAALCNVGSDATSGAKVFYGGSTATIGGSAVNGKQVMGAKFLTTTTAASTLQATVLLNRPHVQGQTS